MIVQICFEYIILERSLPDIHLPWHHTECAGELHEITLIKPIPYLFTVSSYQDNNYQIYAMMWYMTWNLLTDRLHFVVICISLQFLLQALTNNC